MPIHDLGRATEVQVDAGRAQAGQTSRVLGQAHRVGTHQLGPDWDAGRRAAAVPELGDDAVEHALGQQRAGDADELGHAAVDPADARQDVAQREIEQPFHRGEQQGHAVVLVASGAAR